MEFTELGRTKMKVSVAGLGCGGFSQLGLGTGGSEDDAVRLVRAALDLGVNLVDTAAAYRTEPVVGRAIGKVSRDSVIVSTKCSVAEGERRKSPDEIVQSLDTSLRRLATDHVDVFMLHMVAPHDYAYARDAIAPAILAQKDKGKVRFIGITETAPKDPGHAMLSQAVPDGLWDVVMVAFHMMHQNARQHVFPLTQAADIGTLLMFAVRGIFARPDMLRATLLDLSRRGQIPQWTAEETEPLAFLLHAGGASSRTDAAYRFVRHEPGVDVVLFGTGSQVHLRDNIQSILKPALPHQDQQRLRDLFGHLVGIGLTAPGTSGPPPSVAPPTGTPE